MINLIVLQALVSMLTLAVQDSSVSAELRAKVLQAANQTTALIETCAKTGCVLRSDINPAKHRAVQAAEMTFPVDGYVWNASGGPLRVTWEKLPGSPTADWPLFVRLDMEGDFGRGVEERPMTESFFNIGTGGSAVIPSQNLRPGSYRILLVGLPVPSMSSAEAWSIAMPLDIAVR